MLRFQLLGNFPRGHVICSFVNSSFQPPPHAKALIEHAWNTAKASLGDKLFDGPMCRLESFRLLNDSLLLNLSLTSYKQFLGTNLTHAALADQLGQNSLASPLGLSSALTAADGTLLLGQRNNLVAYYPNRIHPFAGALEPHPHNTDVFAEIQRELHEELALTPSAISDLQCLAIAEDRSLRQPELVFLVRSTLTQQQIQSQLDPTEHLQTFAVKPNPAAALHTLQHQPLLTPIAAATLLLWGRETFGLDWFNAASTPLIS